MSRATPALHDVVISKVSDGHLLLMVTGSSGDGLSLVYRGNAWNVQYAVARAARLASGKGGSLWYTDDGMATLEYLETFRGSVHNSTDMAIARDDTAQTIRP